MHGLQVQRQKNLLSIDDLNMKLQQAQEIIEESLFKQPVTTAEAFNFEACFELLLR